jgi:hypothetical protein
MLDGANLPYGVLVTCGIDAGGDSDSFQIFANAGTRLVVRLVNVSGSTGVCLRVLNQRTLQEIQSNVCATDLEEDIDVSASSVYSFRVTRQFPFTGDYSLNVECVGANCGPATLADFPDVNGDGIGDIVVRRGNQFLADTAKDGGAPEFSIRYGAANETIFFADMDGDGVDEVVIRRGNAYLIDSANDGGRPEQVLRFGTASDQVLAYDIDNDGRDDLVIRRGNRLLGDTAHDGTAAEKVITLFVAGETFLPRSSR